MYRFYHLGLEIGNGLLSRSENEFLLFDVLVLIVLVNFEKLLVHDLLGRSKILAFVIIELYEQRIQILSFEVDVQGVPLAMQAIVVEELGPVGVVSLWLSHHHRQHRNANWALQKPLAFVLLRLGLSDCEHITAKFAVEIIDLLL